MPVKLQSNGCHHDSMARARARSRSQSAALNAPVAPYIPYSYVFLTPPGGRAYCIIVDTYFCHSVNASLLTCTMSTLAQVLRVVYHLCADGKSAKLKRVPLQVYAGMTWDRTTSRTADQGEICLSISSCKNLEAGGVACQHYIIHTREMLQSSKTPANAYPVDSSVGGARGGQERMIRGCS